MSVNFKSQSLKFRDEETKVYQVWESCLMMEPGQKPMVSLCVCEFFFFFL